LATLKPEVLALPEPLLKMIPPRPPDTNAGENISRFGPVRRLTRSLPAEAAAAAHPAVLFNRNGRRAGEFMHDADNPGLQEVLDAIIGATWKNATWKKVTRSKSPMTVDHGCSFMTDAAGRQRSRHR